MSESGYGDIPYRIRIGCAGIRSADQVEKFRAAVNNLLGNQPGHSRILELFGADHKELIDSLKFTKIAFTLITSYYEGANQLLADEIIRRDGARIQLILPGEESQFEKKFTNQKSLVAFQTLVKNEALIRFPIRIQKDSSDSIDAVRRAHRYIVDHCDVLVVIGEPSADEKDLLNYAKLKKRPVVRIQANSNIDFEKGYGLNRTPLQRLEKFNKKRIPPDEIEAYSKNVYSDIFDKEGEKIPDKSKSFVRDMLIPNYARASIIAKRYQRDYKLAGNLIYVFSMLAAISVALAVETKFLPAVWYFLELLLLGLILLLVIILNRSESHKRWIETRFLVERIRAASFMAAAGVEVSPIYLPPYMGAAHRQDDWMVMAFHEIWERMPLMKGCEGEECGLISSFIDKAWIENQIEYHEAKARRFHHYNHLLEYFGWGAFLVGLVIAGVHVISLIFGGEHVGTIHDWKFYIHEFLVILAIALPAAAASIEGIRKHNEFSRIATLSENMEEQLRELKQRFHEAHSLDSLNALLREADELMLHETQGWLLLMRFLKVEPVL